MCPLASVNTECLAHPFLLQERVCFFAAELGDITKNMSCELCSIYKENLDFYGKREYNS